MTNVHNFCLNTDSYKQSHFMQYPPDTQYICSYIEARDGGAYDSTIFLGLQPYLKEYLNDPVTGADVFEAANFCKKHGLPFNFDGWSRLVNDFHGCVENVIKIQAVKEGTLVPTGNILLRIENTEPGFHWLISHIETSLLRAIWYPTTVATQSFMIKRDIKKALEDTADNLDSLDFKLHDFGARGVSSFESAGLGGMAHLACFKGTDTITGALFANRYYNAELPVGFSIPAAEHSSITSWANEKDAFENMLDKFGKDYPLVAVVSDSYDIYNACGHIWGEVLKDKVNSFGSTLVVRPDSGDPVQIVSNVIELLMKKFGERTNSKGYRMLPDNVRVIQGDGINHASIRSIYTEMFKRKLSAENVAFGMGGALLQHPNRDTLSFAMKCSAIKMKNGTEWLPVQKKPSSDLTKASKAGYLDLFYNTEFKSYRTGTGKPNWAEEYALKTPYSWLEYGEDGSRYSSIFEKIRAKINSQL